jgi:excisionase family DNA binding protein
MTTATPVPLLTTREVSEIYRCSERRVRELVAEGALTPVRFSERGRMRFRLEDVERLIAGEERTP